MKKNLTGRTNFNGSFDLNGVTIPVPKSSRELTVNLDGRYGGPMVYYYFDENHRPRSYSLGVLYSNNDFSEFTIFFTNSPEGWTSENGTMITAPASNRDEALKIANDLMRIRLEGLILK